MHTYSEKVLMGLRQMTITNFQTLNKEMCKTSLESATVLCKQFSMFCQSANNMLQCSTTLATWKNSPDFHNHPLQVSHVKHDVIMEFPNILAFLLSVVQHSQQSSQSLMGHVRNALHYPSLDFTINNYSQILSTP